MGFGVFPRVVGRLFGSKIAVSGSKTVKGVLQRVVQFYIFDGFETMRTIGMGGEVTRPNFGVFLTLQ